MSVNEYNGFKFEFLNDKIIVRQIPIHVPCHPIRGVVPFRISHVSFCEMSC